MISEKEFSRNLSTVKEQIEKACDKYGRSAEDVTLLPVTKNWPINAVKICEVNGIKRVGENRVQEALQKMESTPGVQAKLSFLLHPTTKSSLKCESTLYHGARDHRVQ